VLFFFFLDFLIFLKFLVILFTKRTKIMSFLITNHYVAQDFSWTWSYPIFHKYFCKNIYITHNTTSFRNKMASMLCIQAYRIVYPWKCLNFINHTYSTAFNFYKNSLFYFSKLGWNEGYHAANSIQQKGNLAISWPHKKN
jgi:hypothetical protein